MNKKSLCFVVNPGAGKNDTDWEKLISEHFASHPFDVEFIRTEGPTDPVTLRKKIASTAPDAVIAVGGDGTLKLVVDSVMELKLPVGLIPGGSANGMAKELNIPLDPKQALQVISDFHLRKIHLTRINDHTCIHLSDIGFNAYVVKKFEESDKRGMWTYVKSAWKVLWSHSRMNVQMKIGDEYISRDASMVVIANATSYGTGVVINPKGNLGDNLFEVVIVKKISFAELFKMRFSHKPFHPKKTEIFQTTSLRISTVHHVHFQVDGEYLGKLYSINAEIIPDAVTLIVPAGEKNEQPKN